MDELTGALVVEGKAYYGSLPWHTTKDPYHLFVAEFFLRRTTRTVVKRVQQQVLAEYPTAAALADADPERLVDMARDAGLFNRTRKIVEAAQQVVNGGGFKPDRSYLLGIESVGPYIADAVLLYAYDQKTFPLDSSVQRVLYRAVTGQEPKKNSNPYRDAPLVEAVGRLTDGRGVNETRLLHQGVLAVAWVACRTKPACPRCPVNQHCCYAAETAS